MSAFLLRAKNSSGFGIELGIDSKAPVVALANTSTTSPKLNSTQCPSCDMNNSTVKQ